MPRVARPGFTEIFWQDEIFPYIKSEQLFNCPSDSLVTNGTANMAYVKYPERNWVRFGSYIANWTYQSGVGNASIPCSSPGKDTGLALAAVEESATTVQVLESPNNQLSWSVLYSDNAGDQPTIQAGSNPKRLGGFYSVIERHLETTNTLYVDGHVKAMKIDALAKVSTNGSGCMSQFTVQSD